ncbi:hypothetical protein L210DRAFT_3550834 [Boletus edulis BED1]|uniref:Flavin-nucleotide-binding protein n=1 Tax=Boletus edulis BED1 TaxID=1328754 RepID=A0AAD4BMQ4_BOLED|nr:hypothetical protein L210DRAFT_3550834 [Boletus edulis BED1]
MDADETRSYPRESRNVVNRLSKRAAYDYETIHGIVNAASVVHVSFLPPSPSGNYYENPQELLPMILPMIGKIGVYPNGGDEAPVCYLHGHVSSRLMKISPTTSALDAAESDGLSVCIAATHIDGLVLALNPFSHSYNYRSAILQGAATVVSDGDEKLWAMTLITNGVLPHRWENTNPPTPAEMQSTQILKVRIVTASAKIRAEGPHDQRSNVQNEELVRRVWTGVVPVFEGFGEPVPSTYNGVPTLPEDIREYLRQENVKRKNDAIRAAKGGDHGVVEQTSTPSL